MGPGSRIACQRCRNVFPIHVQHPRQDGRKLSAAVSSSRATLHPLGMEPHPALPVSRDFGSPVRRGRLSCPDLPELQESCQAHGALEREARQKTGSGRREGSIARLAAHVCCVPHAANCLGHQSFCVQRSLPFSSLPSLFLSLAFLFFFSSPRLVLRQ